MECGFKRNWVKQINHFYCHCFRQVPGNLVKWIISCVPLQFSFNLVHAFKSVKTHTLIVDDESLGIRTIQTDKNLKKNGSLIWRTASYVKGTALKQRKSTFDAAALLTQRAAEAL